jgi:hypothetical protein
MAFRARLNDCGFSDEKHLVGGAKMTTKFS